MDKTETDSAFEAMSKCTLTWTPSRSKVTSSKSVMAILNPFFAKRPVTMVRCLISKADASNLSIANILVFMGVTNTIPLADYEIN
ncbi:hypothetical protein D024_4987 [Vibrio parahaemolyticus 3259]|nr:hypothetical protein VPBB_A0835 [Vibrio parahaemolyticus BB22OP]EQL84026.1 hypothetical protein D019_2902 [Vibrio parahaemolyticus VP2007-095]EQM11644.1 hypothetical protein D024_4987 [Vibrio parahaemolyticus 3259]ETJ91947.1 hypothetical protein D029_0847 [Vibrio parahaemolyticus 970107]EXJ28704.1 hypothetical protein D048_2451 [Vibrio parahaemolyticus VPTS-2009]EXJ47211.1 hypothetical protein D049_0971 [Vibrio parahaemolyticus VPTS-2010]EXJ49608.1 hypothetical protein D047_0715 [Vibrio pa